MDADSVALPAASHRDEQGVIRPLCSVLLAVTVHVSLLWGLTLDTPNRGGVGGRSTLEVALLDRADAPEPAPAPASLPRHRRSPQVPVERSTRPALPVPEPPAPATGDTGAAARPGEIGPALPSPSADVPPVPAGLRGRIDARPRYRTNPAPRYPPAAQRRRQQGVVLLSVSVSASGAPLAIEIQRSSGYEALDRAAVEAVRRWQFEPGVLDGEPVASQVEVPIRFELD